MYVVLCCCCCCFPFSLKQPILIWGDELCWKQAQSLWEMGMLWFGQAEPYTGLEEKADSRERGHLKFRIQAAHLVCVCHLLTQEIQRSFQKQLADFSSTLFKKSDTEWQLSFSAISFFFVCFTDLIIKESYWFWCQISHDAHKIS